MTFIRITPRPPALSFADMIILTFVKHQSQEKALASVPFILILQIINVYNLYSGGLEIRIWSILAKNIIGCF